MQTLLNIVYRIQGALRQLKNRTIDASTYAAFLLDFTPFLYTDLYFGEILIFIYL